ncbi:hypothetical protein ACFX2H_007012 [Malus domestica]
MASDMVTGISHYWCSSCAMEVAIDVVAFLSVAAKKKRKKKEMEKENKATLVCDGKAAEDKKVPKYVREKQEAFARRKEEEERMKKEEEERQRKEEEERLRKEQLEGKRRRSNVTKRNGKRSCLHLKYA